MDRKLDVGGTLSQIFSTYGAQAGVLLPVAFGLFLVVAVMAVKPSGDDTGTLLIGAAILLAAVAVGARALSRPLEPEQAAAATD